MTVDHTRAAAEFVVGTQFESIPGPVVRAARDAILDGVGVALAGSREPAGRIAADLAREEDAREESAVFGHGFRTSSLMAAFANGVAVHALDYDSSFAIMGQPMAGLTPALFALAEPRRATGRQLLEAYIVGYEVTGKVARSMPRVAGEGEWHATGTLGTLGCVAAASRLLGLEVGQACMALGIATSMAGGVTSNFGTMSKPLHAGLAARNGVLAARLAQRGFSGNARTLESGGGFLAAFAPGVSHDLRPLEELGESWELDGGVRVKSYPCGGLTHSAVDAVLALRAEHDFTADQIERIDVHVTSYTANRIVYLIPQTGLQGKFSMPYILARTVLDGELTPETFSDEAIKEPTPLALAERVHMQADPALEHSASGGRPARVRINLTDGRTLAHQVDYPKGNPQAPLTDQELRAKFSTCARRALSATAAVEAMSMLDALETLADVSALCGLLIGHPR